MNDKPPEPDSKPAGNTGDRKTEPVWKSTTNSSSGIFAGIIFLTVMLVLLALLVGGIAILGVPVVWDFLNSTATQAPTPTVSVTYSPTILVNPANPPDMFDRSRLKETDEIVGLWTSLQVKTLSSAKDTNNYNLTVYNDHTYIIYDKAHNTYTLGTWSGGAGLYNIEEPGRDYPSRVLGTYKTVEFQYNVNGNDYTSNSVFVIYGRYYYPGFSHDL